MTIDLKKEKKAAEDYIQILTKTDKYIQGGDVGATQEVRTSQTQKSLTQQTPPKPTPKERLTAYLKSIGQQ
jgi:ABC-type glycerol-3-phosphate transport system substrate-binding protein